MGSRNEQYPLTQSIQKTILKNQNIGWFYTELDF